MYWLMEVVEGLAAKLMCGSEWVMRLRAIRNWSTCTNAFNV